MKTLLTWMCLCLALAVYSREAGAQVVIIANKSLPAHAIDLSTLKALYFLDAKELDGTTTMLFCLKEDNDVTERFFAALGKSFNDTKKVWIRVKLTGNGDPPTALGSEEEVLEKVASTPGAIGFISAGKATAKVKVLLTLQ